MKRWTATVTYRKTDDMDDTISFDFDEEGELGSILESRKISYFSLAAEITLRYNGHMGMPVSMAQCLMDGDFETMGMMQ